MTAPRRKVCPRNHTHGKSPIMDFTFAVGHPEHHVVNFKWNQFIGQCKISVDGDVVIRSRPLAWDELKSVFGPRYECIHHLIEIIESARNTQYVRMWQFEVGVAEKHLITIVKERPAVLAGLRPHKYAFFVDDKLIHSTDADFAVSPTSGS